MKKVSCSILICASLSRSSPNFHSPPAKNAVLASTACKQWADETQKDARADGQVAEEAGAWFCMLNKQRMLSYTMFSLISFHYLFQCPTDNNSQPLSLLHHPATLFQSTLIYSQEVHNACPFKTYLTPPTPRHRSGSYQRRMAIKIYLSVSTSLSSKARINPRADLLLTVSHLLLTTQHVR